MNSFALLFGKILESSLWIKESKETRLVWITLLAMKDRDGVVQASVVGLADRAKVSEPECRKALGVLLAPDPDDTSKVNGGRRIEEVAGVGWKIVNHELYRFSTQARRAIWAEQKALQRARLPKPGMPLRGERRAGAAEARGDLAAADRIAAEGLPSVPAAPHSI